MPPQQGTEEPNGNILPRNNTGELKDREQTLSTEIIEEGEANQEERRTGFSEREPEDFHQALDHQEWMGKIETSFVQMLQEDEPISKATQRT